MTQEIIEIENVSQPSRKIWKPIKARKFEMKNRSLKIILRIFSTSTMKIMYARKSVRADPRDVRFLFKMTKR